MAMLDDDGNELIRPIGQPYRHPVYPSARYFECQLAGWRRACTPHMAWDHCHTHGTIRGTLCTGHNLLIEHPDVQGEPELIGYLGACAGCVEGATYDPDADWDRSVGLDLSGYPRRYAL